MTTDQLTYIIFGVLVIVALIFDLGLLSKKNTQITIKTALWQTIFWVVLAIGFMAYVWYRYGQRIGLEYFSAYLTEWSLSIDNIFVFILIFSFFGVKDVYYARVLLIGILMAIVFRVLFITVGIALVSRFEWILYIFGALLVYTGINMFRAKHDEAPNLSENNVYNFLKRFLPLTPEDGGGKFTIRKNGKKYYTSIFAVVVMLATTDIVFALDSIPAVFGISTHQVVIYTSNIFAVLGLRSLFFLLKGAVGKFAYLQQGIAIVLVFIGLKMLVEVFHIKIPTYISLLVIVVCLVSSMVYSISVTSKNKEKKPAVRGGDIDLH
jgi:tellurite resistance protein TerC